MTYEEWQTCSDLDELLTFARRRGHFSERKRRLFACACCGRLAGMLPEPHRRALTVAERFADGRASRVELTVAWSAAYHDPATRIRHAAWAACTAAGPAEGGLTQAHLSTVSLYAANALGQCSLRGGCEGPGDGAAWLAERARHRALLRDVTPPPRAHRHTDHDLPAAAVAVARWVYEEGRFDDLPILADALEEAGCTDAPLLGHCRGSGEHVRGCWAVELVLGSA
jgi:hypothetical protein